MKPLIILFVYVCCLVNILPLLFSSLHLLYFAPFIILAMYRSSLNQTLWWSLACGLIIDLYSFQTRLGFYAANYCLTTFFLYGYKTHFFEDRPSTLPVMIFCYTALSHFIQAILLVTIGEHFHFSWEWIQTDLLITPLQTSIYGVLCFSLPSSILVHMKKRTTLFGKR